MPKTSVIKLLQLLALSLLTLGASTLHGIRGSAVSVPAATLVSAGPRHTAQAWFASRDRAEARQCISRGRDPAGPSCTSTR
jgi:hypothetical protein